MAMETTPHEMRSLRDRSTCCAREVDRLETSNQETEFNRERLADLLDFAARSDPLFSIARYVPT